MPDLRARLRARLPRRAAGVVDRVGRSEILTAAAALAFYALVSIGPLAVLIAWVGGLLLGEQRVQSVAGALRDIAPQDLGIGGFVERVSGVGTSIGLLALLAALWPASAYGAGLARAFQLISPTKKGALPGLRGRGAFLLALLPVFVLGSLIGGLAAGQVASDGALSQAAGAALTLALAFLLAAGIASAIYLIFPPRRPSAAGVARGAAFTGAGVAVLSLGFVIYLNIGANFSEQYAVSALAALVLLGVWLFLSNVMLLVGYGIALGD